MASPTVPASGACNIGPGQQSLRRRLGLYALAAGVVWVAIVAVFGFLRGLALAAGPLFWGGALGYFEARQQTCVWLAARGRRNMDAGEETVYDRAEQEVLRRQARGVHLRAAATAIGLTVLGWLVA